MALTDAPVTHAAWSGGRALVRQWAGLLGAPLIWFVQFEASYALVRGACHGGSKLPLHLLSLAALLLTASVLRLGLATRRSVTTLPRGELTGGPEGRSWMMGTVGVMVSAFIMLVIVAQWFAAVFIDPCWG